MSEYHVVEIELQDEQTLIDTLVEMGYKPQVHEEAKNLHGYQGDSRQQKAHIIIPRSQVGSASNDVGFERTSNGYKLHISAYDQGGNRFKTKKLKQLYAKNRITGHVKKKSKYRLSSQKTEKDGRITLRVRVQ